MKKRALWIGGAAALALALVGGLAHAHKNPQERAERHAAHMTEKLDDKLNLSAKQEEEAEKIIFAAIMQRHEARQNRRTKIKATWLQSTLSAEQAAALMEGGKRTRQEAKQSMAEAVSQIHALLTPQQREEAASKWAEHLVEEMDDELDLSAKQQKSAKEIVLAAMQERQEAWLQPTLRADSVAALMEGGKQMRQKAKKSMAEAAAKMHAILTPQQREEAADMLRHLSFFGGGHTHGHRGKRGQHGWRGWHDWLGWHGDHDHHRGDNRG